MKEKIWLSSPHMGGNELKYIHRAFEENWVAPLGPNVNGFEEDLQHFLGNGVKVSALSSGTAALHLALIECGVQAGDEVLCQSMTFSASANPIVYQGATPVFVDSEEETWNISPVFLEEAIEDRIKKGKKPKAVIAVSLYGNKIITTSGGGALVCHSQAEKDKAVFLSTQARDNAPHYQHSHIGYNYRMSNITAGIGRGQMEVLGQRIEARRKMYAFYELMFKDTEGIELLREPSSDFFSNHWLSAIVIDKAKVGFDREDLRLAFLEENIESRPLWKPMHLQPVFSGVPYYGEKVSEELFDKGLCLPSGSNLTEGDRERIMGVLKKMGVKL